MGQRDEGEHGRGAELLDQGRGEKRRGDGADRVKEHQGGGQFHPLLACGEVMGMGGGERIDRDRRHAEKEGGKEDTIAAQPRHQNGRATGKDGGHRQADQHAAPVELVGQPAQRELRHAAAQHIGGKEQRDAVGGQPHLDAVDRADHAKRRAGDARDDDAHRAKRGSPPGQAGAQARGGGHRGLFHAADRDRQKRRAAGQRQQVVGEIGGRRQHADDQLCRERAGDVHHPVDAHRAAPRLIRDLGVQPGLDHRVAARDAGTRKDA